jgi:heme-degrading monooxygenase HmoA
MYITVTTVKAPSEHLDHIAQAFRDAAPSMQGFPGCTGFELWRKGDTLQAVSRWESREAIEAYARSDLFTAHHPGAATGQGAGPGQVEYYEGEVLF